MYDWQSSYNNCGADEQIRTAYLLITNEVLYRLSYISICDFRGQEAARSGSELGCYQVSPPVERLSQKPFGTGLFRTHCPSPRQPVTALSAVLKRLGRIRARGSQACLFAGVAAAWLRGSCVRFRRPAVCLAEAQLALYPICPRCASPISPFFTKGIY